MCRLPTIFFVTATRQKRRVGEEAQRNVILMIIYAAGSAKDFFSQRQMSDCAAKRTPSRVGVHLRRRVSSLSAFLDLNPSAPSVTTSEPEDQVFSSLRCIFNRPAGECDYLSMPLSPLRLSLRIEP